MSGRIRVLPPEVSNRIAAGEVVENPAAVVRELVENALDAEARHIKVFVKEGGRRLISVSDDGTGIGREDVETAFLRHATSKIRDVEDLGRLHSLGFRGEALASIASVAEVTMLTRTAEEDAGTLVRLEGGQVVDRKEAARAPGTTVTVENLFAKVPARLKFLRQDATEVRAIKQTLIRILLGHPGVQMEFILDDVPVFRYPAVGGPLERIVQVFGGEFEEALLPVREEVTGMVLAAWLGHPQFTKPNRQFQYLFVNRRAVEAPFFYPLVNNLYSRLVPAGRQPVVFFFLTVDPADVDVNVHPAKREVRFRRPVEVYEFLYAAGRRVLEGGDVVGRPIRLEPSAAVSVAGVSTPSTEGEAKARIAEAMRDFAERRGPQLFGHAGPVVSRNPDQGVTDFVERSGGEASNRTFAGLFGGPVVILGQLFNTYILVESGADLFLVDQHAAHERVIFERLKREFEERKIAGQPLLIPFEMEFEPVRAEAVRRHMTLLQELGYEVDEFGRNAFLVRSVPSFLRRGNDRELFADLVELLAEEEGRGTEPSAPVERLLESMACHSAVKAGERQGFEEMEALLEQVAKMGADAVHCPHGRPFVVRLSKGEIERLFARRF